MPQPKRSLPALLALSILAATIPARAWTFSVLTAFQGGIDGIEPGNLIVQGNTLTAVAGAGVYNSGGIVTIDLATGTRQTLYSFTGGGDGEGPDTLVAYDGRLFGTAFDGGSAESILGGGTLFSLNPATGAPNRHLEFTGSNGALPNDLIAADGALYGASLYGPSGYGGTVFRFDPATGQQTLLQTFTAATTGYGPGALTLVGNTLYGVAQAGPSGNGLIFKIDLATQQESTVYQFTGGADEANPSGLAYDGANTLYGTTTGGAQGQCGTIFALNLKTAALTTLYSFTGQQDGQSPVARLFGANRIYGYTQYNYQTPKYHGSIFAFDPASASFTTLHRFSGGDDGSAPNSLIAAGNALYGATLYGGPTQSGVIFKLTP